MSSAGKGVDRQVGEMATEDQERASQADLPPAPEKKYYRPEPIRRGRFP